MSDEPKTIGLRERIARIVDPDAFAGECPTNRDEAREKATLILNECAAVARRHSNYSGLHPVEDIAWQIAEEMTGNDLRHQANDR